MKHGINFSVMSRLIATTLVILVTFTIVVYICINEIIANNLYNRGLHDMQVNTTIIDDALSEIYQLIEFISLNNEVKTFLEKEDYLSNTDQVIAVTRLMNELKESIYLKKYVHSLCLVTLSGKTYWDTCPYDSFFINWFEKNAVDNSADYRGFTKKYEFPPSRNDQEPIELISHVSNVIDMKNGNPTVIGQLIINLDYQLLMKNVFSENQLFDQICVYDQRGLEIYRNGDVQFPQEIRSYQGSFIRTSDGLYFINNIKSCNWKIISRISKDQMVDMNDFPFTAIFLIIIPVSLLLFMILVLPLLLNLSKQIVTLDHAMNSVANGDLNKSVSLHGPRELVNISNGFNNMVTKTKLYMDEALRNQEEKQKVSFELLLAKINPHFIYNTLNSLIYLARKDKTKEIIDLTSAFIYLLQDSIHLEKNSLFEKTEIEMEVIDKYITIQKYRYANRFVFTSHFDEELENTVIPKNILQPLVENALIHGVCGKATMGHIELSVAKEEERMAISIIDDGIGMEQKVADALLSDECEVNENKASKFRQIGIQNITQRLKYIYKSDCSFAIVSRPGEGTKITIRLPVRCSME